MAWTDSAKPAQGSLRRTIRGTGNPPNRPTGVIRCSECGKEVPEEAKFCPHCGVHFEDPSCANPDCDAVPSEGERFCSKCGWPIQI